MQPPYTIQNLFLIYSEIASIDPELYAKKKKKLVLPKISQVLISQICVFAANSFIKDPTVIDINENIIIIGDLHGHLLDLLRILYNFGMPPSKSYLFLGDIVDRGEFSLETITFIFLMKILFPKNIFIIRGNHEFSEMCEQGGFYQELTKVYNDTLVKAAFNNAFSYIPLAAIIRGTFLCVHGGIGPTLESIDQIREIQRPLNDFNSEPILSLLWSDPSQKIIQFRPSPRGLGYLFGADPLSKLLSKNKLTHMIRGHECVESGIEMSLKGKCITVFSASNYCGLQPNKAAVLPITNKGIQKPVYFSPLNYLFRTNAKFVATDCKTIVLQDNCVSKALPQLRARSRIVYDQNRAKTDLYKFHSSRSVAPKMQRKLTALSNRSSTYF